MRPLAEQVVVVTGASSGIGRETARRLAARGTKVVLAARNAEALHTLAREIREQDGVCHVVVTDVAEWPQVLRLAEEAVSQFGGIDTWVNNAAVSEYAPIADMAVEDIERIVQVNLLGTVYGAKAALPYLAQRGGTVINVGSVLAERAIALQGIYCATKHGVKGFTEALRLEQEQARTNITVTLILPSVINTPFYTYARNRMAVKPRPIPPVYAPQAVAEAIVFACEHKRRDITVGAAGKGLAFLEQLSPMLVDRLMLAGGAIFKTQQANTPADPQAPDNLFAPPPTPGATVGAWGRGAQPFSIYTRALELHPARKAWLLIAAIAGLTLWLRRKS